MLSTIKIVKKIHSHFFGPRAHGTGPKHGVKIKKMTISSNFVKKNILGSIKYAEYEKNNEKNPSLFLRPVGPWDSVKT